MKNKNLKPHYDEIIRLNLEEKIGYKKLAKMFNCGKSTIEYIIKSRAINSGRYFVKRKEVCKNYIKNPIVAEVRSKNRIEKRKKLARKKIKDYWVNNTIFGSNDDIILPIGLK